MKNNGIKLAWITAKNFEETIKFYTEVVGLKLMVKDTNWAEVQGEDGIILGIGTTCDETPLKAGQNAVVTFAIDNIEEAREELHSKGTELVGNIVEIPGHVKLQLFKDPNGNLCHLVQELA